MTLLTGTHRRDPDRGMAQQRTVTRDMPKLDFRASFEPSTVDVEKRTVEVVWTTGAAVLRRGWDGSYFEELSLDPKHVRMGRLQSGTAPLLNSHDGWDIRGILGVVMSARLEKGRGIAIVRFDSGPAGEEAFRMVREGTLRSISVGYSTYKMQKVEGGDTTVPTYRAVDWEPAELSLVPIPADAGSVTRSGGGMTPCEFIPGEAMPDPDETATTTTTTTPTASQAPTIDEAQVRAAAATAERARITAIQRAARALNRPAVEIQAAIDDGSTVDAYYARAIDAIATAAPADGGVIPIERRATAHVSAGEDSRDKFIRGASAWMFVRSTMGSLLGEYARASGARIELDPGEFRGMSLLDLARESLERSGVKTRGLSKMDLAGLALSHRGAGGMVTTSDFANLLENVQGKILLARYAITPDTYSKICRNGSVSDFRPSPRYRTGSFGKLDKLLEGGEYVQKAIADGEKQSITADTVGNVIAISRKTLINDDMGAFTSLASDLGRAAKLSVELDFYALLALNAGLGPNMSDGLSLFHATHKNISTGAALSAAALDLDRVQLGSQTDVTGNEVLDLKPTILLLSNTLGGQARVINDSAYDPDTVANKAQNKPNIAGKMFRDIVDTARLTGTRRYIFADPSVAPTFEVAWLDGQQEPYLESQVPFDHDGLKWKVRLDYAVGAIDYRGAVTNAGA